MSFRTQAFHEQNEHLFFLSELVGVLKFYNKCSSDCIVISNIHAAAENDSCLLSCLRGVRSIYRYLTYPDKEIRALALSTIVYLLGLALIYLKRERSLEIVKVAANFLNDIVAKMDHDGIFLPFYLKLKLKTDVPYIVSNKEKENKNIPSNNHTYPPNNKLNNSSNSSCSSIKSHEKENKLCVGGRAILSKLNNKWQSLTMQKLKQAEKGIWLKIQTV